MAVEAAELIGGALGGAVVTSVLAPLIGQRRERLDLRADVLRHLNAVERHRWAPDSSLDEFRAAVVALRASALVARVNRRVVEQYLLYASAARSTSEARWDETQDLDVGGPIPVPLADLVRSAAAVVVEHVWHPTWRRLQVRRDLANLVSEQSGVERVDWNLVRVP